MKKLLKLIFVRRQETKDKWWHRLALVLIYGSTIVGAIFLGILLVTEESDNWAKYSYTAYSFEEGYPTAKGKEIDCKFPVTSLGDLPLISIFHCGDFSSDSEFLERYSRARDTYDRLQGLREEKAPSLSFSKRKLQYSELSSIQKNRIDDGIMVELIQSGEMGDVKVKRVMSFEYATFLGNWGLYLVGLLGWFVFWESIVYRTLLYVVFGRQNK